MILPAILALFAFKFLCSGKSFCAKFIQICHLFLCIIFFWRIILNYSGLTKVFWGEIWQCFVIFRAVYFLSVFLSFWDFWKQNVIFFFKKHSHPVINGNFCRETEKCVWAMSWRRFKGLCELIDFSACLVPIIDLVMILTSFFFFFFKHTCRHIFTHTQTRFMSHSKGGTKEKVPSF